MHAAPTRVFTPHVTQFTEDDQYKLEAAASLCTCHAMHRSAHGSVLARAVTPGFIPAHGSVLARAVTPGFIPAQAGWLWHRYSAVA